jgi:hypothetical protein
MHAVRSDAGREETDLLKNIIKKKTRSMGCSSQQPKLKTLSLALTAALSIIAPTAAKATPPGCPTIDVGVTSEITVTNDCTITGTGSVVVTSATAMLVSAPSSIGTLSNSGTITGNQVGQYGRRS